MSLKMYLAGSIRDKVKEDIEWRERLIDALTPYILHGMLCILNPLGGKHYDPVNKQWTMSGVESSAQHIWSQDSWCVDRTDLLVCNFLALGDKYPNIGTLVEFGRSTSKAMLRYVIIPKGYKGHENPEMYNLHPFIVHNAAHVFYSVDECIEFLIEHIPVLAGVAPRFIKEAVISEEKFMPTILSREVN